MLGAKVHRSISVSIHFFAFGPLTLVCDLPIDLLKKHNIERYG